MDMPEVLKPPEVAKWLKCNLSTVYRLCKRGAIPHFRIGTEIRFYRSELIDWMSELQQVGSARPRRRERRTGGADPD